MNTFHCSTFTTPLGDFTIACNERAEIVATAFGNRSVLQTRLGPARLVAGDDVCAASRAAVLAYFAGARRKFSLPLAATGSAFQHRVWAALREIPFGETRSYGALARELDSSPRAVGRGNATNPICLIVPCHRVIGADGSLTGFAFGEELKRRLLEHEGAFARA